MYTRSTHRWLKHLDFIIVDEIALQIAFILGYMIRHGFWNLPYLKESYRMMAVLLLVLDVLVPVMFNTMHEVMKRGYYREFELTCKQAVLVFVAMIFCNFTVQTSDVYSRITIVLTAAFHILFGYVSHIVWKRIIRNRKKNVVRDAMLLVADVKSAEKVIQSVNPSDTHKIVGIALTDADSGVTECCGIPVVADLKGAADYICREWIDGVFVYSVANEQVNTLMDQCREMSVPVHLRLPVDENSIGDRSFVEKIGGYSVVTTTSNYVTPGQALIKRLMDIAGGLVGSLIALLVLLIVGPMIKKASPGPVLFKQERIGQNGRKFKMLKIRSMYLDAEERKKDLMKQNRVADGMMFKLDWDPRIIGNEILPDGTKKTGIGEFIRKTSLDEFPQFFNVLKGEMSLVGTRPPTVDEWEKYEYHHRARLATKPGLTGMWQVSGRSEITDFEEVVKLDTEYINNWSVGLDLRILFGTIKAVFRQDGAM